MKAKHSRVLSMNYKPVPVTCKTKSFTNESRRQDSHDKQSNQSRLAIQSSEKSGPNTAIKKSDLDEVTKVLAEDVRQSNFLFDSLNSLVQPQPFKSHDRRESMQVTLKEAILNFEKEKELRHQNQEQILQQAYTEQLEVQVETLQTDNSLLQRQLIQTQEQLRHSECNTSELRIQLKENQMRLGHMEELLKREQMEKDQNAITFNKILQQLTHSQGEKENVFPVYEARSRKYSHHVDYYNTQASKSLLFGNGSHDASGQPSPEGNRSQDNIDKLKNQLQTNQGEQRANIKKRRQNNYSMKWPQNPLLSGQYQGSQSSIYSPLPTQPSTNLNPISDPKFMFSPAQNSPLMTTSQVEFHANQFNTKDTGFRGDMGTQEENIEESREMICEEIGGIEEEEKNLEKMISGGDYSPNSHTFFKHPFPKDFKETTPHKYNTIPHEVVPQPAQIAIQRTHDYTKKQQFSSIAKKTKIIHMPRAFNTKQNSPKHPNSSGVLQQHPLCTSHATITNTTSGSHVSPTRQKKVIIPDSLIKKANFQGAGFQSLRRV